MWCSLFPPDKSARLCRIITNLAKEICDFPAKGKSNTKLCRLQLLIRNQLGRAWQFYVQNKMGGRRGRKIKGGNEKGLWNLCIARESRGGKAQKRGDIFQVLVTSLPGSLPERLSSPIYECSCLLRSLVRVLISICPTSYFLSSYQGLSVLSQ